MNEVSVRDSFFAPRRETLRSRTIPAQLEQLRKHGQLDALRAVAGGRSDLVPHVFWESDVGKWVEAASATLSWHPDGDLDEEIEAVIELLSEAQQPDGYLNSYFTLVAADKRFTDLRDGHELYTAGHLIEAGVVHFLSTGKESMLRIGRSFAELLLREFGEGGFHYGGYDGHPEIELALVRMAGVTQDSRYMDLAATFLDMRGKEPYYFDAEAEARQKPGHFDDYFVVRGVDPAHLREYCQSHLPVREQRSAVGHCVRAMYLYCAMTDMAIRGDLGMGEAVNALWDDVTMRKMYLTGALGADRLIEGFGPAYFLPDATAYGETCAAVGLVMWSRRMIQLTGHGRHADVMEVALYNAVAAGMSANGTEFFYDNSLASDGSHRRQPWFEVSCCPPNLARLLAQVHEYIYRTDAQRVAIDLYVTGTLVASVGGCPVTVEVDTAYPSSGRMEITVCVPGTPAPFEVSLRIPAWCRNWSLTVDGQAEHPDVCDGYITLARRWGPETHMVLDLDLKAQPVWAHPEVRDHAGLVALRRGPVVFCWEDEDQPVHLTDIALSRELAVQTRWDSTLGGEVLLCRGLRRRLPGNHAQLYSPSPPEWDSQEISITAVPYALWGNRGRTPMQVWLTDAGLV